MTATKPLPIQRPRKAGSIRREIIKIRRAIKTLDASIRDALKDVALNGPVLTVVRTDSHGEGHEKLVPNPWLKVMRESQATIKTLRLRAGLLEVQFADARHAELDPVDNGQEVDEFADL
jgi:hypothetical protein